MTDSVRMSVIANIKTTIEGITIAGGYNFDIQKVHLEKMLGLHINEYPSIIIIPGKETCTEEPIERYTNRLPITLECWIKEDENITQDIDKLLADIKRALLIDYTRGAKAINTKIMSSEPFYGEPTKPYGGVMIDIEIAYREAYGNPYLIG